MATILQTPTPNLSESLKFYQNLNFELRSINGKNYAIDGKLFIEINEERVARAGIKMYKQSWKEEVEKLSQVTSIVTINGGFLLSDNNGIRIYLMESSLDLGEESQQKTVLGNCMGVGVEGISISDMFKVWKLLGFKITMGGEDKSWMVAVNDDGFGISFMTANSCPHLFFNPSISYFNGKNNPEVISNIRTKNIAITEEITHFNKEGIVDNIIIRDPGGLGFFIFND